MKSILFGLLAFASVMLYLPDGGSNTTHAATPGTGISPLLTCPNVTADATGAVAATDVNQTIVRFGAAYPNANFSFLFDRQGNGSVAATDINATITQFGATCPTADNQVARATRWAAGLPFSPADPDCTTGNPPPPMTLPAYDDSSIEAIGYYRGSTPVPGQGIHFFKIELWDGTFHPCKPEGLVYSGQCSDDQNNDADALVNDGCPALGTAESACSGALDNDADFYINDGCPASGPAENSLERLVAQLYVLNGESIGWDGWNPQLPCNDPPPQNCALSGKNVDLFCSPGCSWAAAEGWHGHAHLCTGSVGTVGAFALSGQSAGDCDIGTGTQPTCTVPISVQPCYFWNQRTGWMGHLWNHFINQNKEPVEKNGRFSDCAPPAVAYNICPM
jgi:hypothetical protein